MTSSEFVKLDVVTSCGNIITLFKLLEKLGVKDKKDTSGLSTWALYALVHKVVIRNLAFSFRSPYDTL
jgi:hypothetical protein